MPVHFIGSSAASAPPYDPLVLSPVLWHDFSDAATVPIGTGISAITDKSGNGRTASQATGAKQPAYITGGLSGLNCARFNSAGYFLSTAALTRAQPYVMMIVLKKIGATYAGQNVFGYSTNTGTVIYHNTSPARPAAFSSDTNLIVSGTDIATSVHLITVICNGASSSLYIDDTLSGLGTLGGAFASSVVSYGDNVLSADSDIGEALIIPGVPDTAALGDYLQAKWSTP